TFCYNSKVKLKKFIKTSRRFLGWLLLQGSSLTVRFLPLPCLYIFAKVLANIGFLVAVKQRRIALKSLSIAFGQDKSPSELRKIAKDCFGFLVRAVVEMFFFMQRPQLLKDKVFLDNKHILDKALSKAKGVVLVSGHFGNFPIGLLRLGLEGYSVGGIMRPMRDERVERLFTKLRNKLGIKTIYSRPPKACVDATIKALKNNEIICIQLDQNFGTGGVFVDFFGQRAATAIGPVVFALRTNAVIVPAFIIRQKDNTHRVIFEPEFSLEQDNDFNQRVLINTQRLTNIIESYIRRYPDHWGWIHRRWKTRPKPQANNR
ncbi:MAG: lysophospholipid acyltransferase family protein, partial [Candidatus Omnitrophota bacterium]